MTDTGQKIVVTGGRDFADEAFVYETLDNLRRRGGVRRLAHGGAKGADALAAKWAAERGVECVEYRADWLAYGPAAGPKRNAEMLLAEVPDMVVAYPGGRGTASCVSIARHMGLVVADLRLSYQPPVTQPSSLHRGPGG